MRHYSGFLLLGLISLCLSTLAQTDSTPTPDGFVTEELTYIEEQERGFINIQSEFLETGLENVFVENMPYSGEYRSLIGISGLTPYLWSPNGRYLAYTEFTSDNIYTLYVVDTFLEITAELPNAVAPTWSPDSEQLAFMSFENVYGDSRFIGASLDIANADGSNRYNVIVERVLYPLWGGGGILANRSSDLAMLLIVPETGHTTEIPVPEISIHQQWSEDGTRFLYGTQEEYLELDLYIYDLETKSSENILSDLRTSETFREIIFSADEQQLYVIQQTQIRNYNIDNQDEYTILYEYPVEDGAEVSNLSLSPSGTRLAFTIIDYSGDDRLFFVYSMNIDGSNLQRIGNEEYNQFDPAWKP